MNPPWYRIDFLARKAENKGVNYIAVLDGDCEETGLNYEEKFF